MLQAALDDDIFHARKPEPNIQLWSAVLERAINDIIKKENAVTTSISDIRESKRWILSDDDDNYSFIWVCSQLNIDPALIRKKIAQEKYS